MAGSEKGNGRRPRIYALCSTFQFHLHTAPVNKKPDSNPEPGFSTNIARENAQRGNSLDPIKNASTDLAHCRPSRIAHTTSDCPRRMSPAVKTFGTDVK
jgi:hypothetical protein